MVTIIVPVYNAEKTLRRCVNSIQAQSYRDIEIILVDDGSRDSSEKICRDIKDGDDRVKYYKKNNGGAASARNYGLNIANGEYIQFVDSDDYISADMTQKMVDAIQGSKADLVICGIEYISRKGRHSSSFGTHLCGTPDEMCDVLCKYYKAAIIHSCCNKLYRRSLINQLMSTDYIYGEDYIFNLNYLKNVSAFVTIKDCLYVYDCTNESVTRGMQKNNVEDIIQQYKTAREILDELFESIQLSEILTLALMENLLNEYAKTERIFKIRKESIGKIIGKYQKAVWNIAPENYYEKALIEKNYSIIAQSFRKATARNRVKMWIVNIYAKGKNFIRCDWRQRNAQ